MLHRIKRKLRGKTKFNMDMTTADKTLQNVFAACNQTPNTTPFDKIVLRQKVRTGSLTLSKWIASVMLLLVFLTPLAFQHSFFMLSSSQSEAMNLQIEDHYLKDGMFVMILSGDSIAFDEIYAKTLAGEILYPASIDTSEKSVSFVYTEETLNIYIPDYNNHVLQAVLTPKP